MIPADLETLHALHLYRREVLLRATRPRGGAGRRWRRGAVRRLVRWRRSTAPPPVAPVVCASAAIGPPER